MDEFEMKIVCERLKKTQGGTKVTARITAEYFDMSDQDTVDVQEGLAQGLVALGRRKAPTEVLVRR